MKINLGAGWTPVDGYENWDRKTGQEAYPLAVADGSVDEIRASHILEHFGHRDTPLVLKDWVRALKVGGVLKIAVPDVNKVLAGGGPSLEAFIMGGQCDENDFHGAIFTRGKLAMQMRNAGLSRIKEWTSEVEDCASQPISLNLCGTKRPPADLSRVQPVISIGRLGFTDTTACLFAMMANSGTRPPIVRQGVFWEQAMTSGIEDALTRDPSHILAIDGDTIFTPNHVRELYHLLAEYPQADAICGMQYARERNEIILSTPTGRITADDARDDLTRLESGHFGLTMFRPEVFAKLAKPWICGEVGPDGRWGEGRLEPDMAMWLRFSEAGLGLYQANHVRLGHLQLMVTWADDDLKPFHQYVTDYRRNGPPPFADC